MADQMVEEDVGQAPAEQMPPDGAPQQAPSDGATQGEEPYGAQVLRRTHEDAIVLLQDYDELMGVLDNPGIHKFMTKKMQGIEGDLTKMEQLFQKTYPNLEPLADGEPVDPNMADKELENPEQADSGPPPYQNAGKSLKKGKKSLDGAGGMLCSCCKGAIDGPSRGQDQGQWMSQGDKHNLQEIVSELFDLAKPDSSWGEEKRYKSYHYYKLLEPMMIGAMTAYGKQDKKKREGQKAIDPTDPAKTKPLPPEMWDHDAIAEHNLKLGLTPQPEKTPVKPDWIYGQDGALGEKGISDVTTASEAMSVNTPPPDGGYDFSEVQMNCLKALSDASDLFKMLAFEKAFGDIHRKACAACSEALQAVPEYNDTASAAQATFEPGEMGEKSRRRDRLEGYGRQQDEDEEQLDAQTLRDLRRLDRVSRRTQERAEQPQSVLEKPTGEVEQKANAKIDLRPEEAAHGRAAYQEAHQRSGGNMGDADQSRRVQNMADKVDRVRTQQGSHAKPIQNPSGQVVVGLNPDGTPIFEGQKRQPNILRNVKSVVDEFDKELKSLQKMIQAAYS